MNAWFSQELRYQTLEYQSFVKSYMRDQSLIYLLIPMYYLTTLYSAMITDVSCLIIHTEEAVL